MLRILDRLGKLNFGVFLITTLLAVILSASVAAASLQVAFIEWIDPNGKTVALEKDGKFGHIAIEYKGGWLHVDRYNGVQWVPELSLLGKSYTVLINRDHPALNLQNVSPYLGKPFDLEFDWQDNSRLYCSELVGKLLNLKPQPMSFDTPYWSKKKIHAHGKLGLSPDDVFKMLLAKGFTFKNCNDALRGYFE